MGITCMIFGMIGGSIIYFILHGACVTKRWLKGKKEKIDKNLKG